MQEIMQVTVESLLYSSFSLQIGAYTLRTVANILSWLGGLRGMRQSE